MREKKRTMYLFFVKYIAWRHKKKRQKEVSKKKKPGRREMYDGLFSWMHLPT
jgi:hypothetical protein